MTPRTYLTPEAFKRALEQRLRTSSESMQYEGLRFRAECKLAGKIYGQQARRRRCQ